MITCTVKSALPDLVLPLSNFSSRMLESDAVSSINIFIPNGIYFSEEINLRLDGYLEIDSDGVVFAYSDSIASIVLFEGNTTNTVQIAASGDFPNLPLPTIALEGVSFRTININGDIRMRAKFDPNIIPGATVSYEGELHFVNQITVSQSVDSYTMELFINA